MTKLGPTDSASNPVPRALYEESADILKLSIGGTAGRSTEVATGLEYATLRQANPCYDAKYWHRLRALYRGGKKLLGDRDLMREVFPPHRDELDDIYKERCKRAFYIPYAGEIVDHIIASLTAEPLVVSLTDAEEGEPLPDFYDKFVKDCSPPGGKEVNINQLVRKTLLDAMQVQTGWVLYDLETPKTPDGMPVRFGSLRAQETSGALDVYVDTLDAESVIDWDEDSSGELIWAIVHTSECRREGIAGRRNRTTERWVYWTRDSWELYEITYDNDKKPRDTDLVRRISGGIHTHKKVPLRRLSLPDGLWVMEKLEGLAREHFNKRAGLSWAELQSLLPELYEFLAPEASSKGAIIGENQEDPGRAFSQNRGQGFVQVRGGDDTAMFVGPDSAPFTHTMESCNNVRDEMHRVTHQMKLSVDNTAASMQRSGESKAHDKAAESVVLTFLGLLAREFLKGLLQDVCLARNELELMDQWKVKGMEKFDDVATSDAVDLGVALETVPIPSPTFQRRFKMNLARAVLGSEASPKDLEMIEEELEKNIPDEQFDPATQAEKEQQQLNHELALKVATPAATPPGAPPPKDAP